MAFSSPPPTSRSAAPNQGDNRYTYFPMALGVITTIFFMWGFLTSLNDVLIPHLKSTFQLSYTQAILVQLAFFGAYFLMGLPAGKLVSAAGYKKGIVYGLGIAAVGALGF